MIHRPPITFAFRAVLLATLLGAGPAVAFEVGETRLSLGLDPTLTTGSLSSVRGGVDGAVRLNLGLTGPLAAGPALVSVPDGFHLSPGGRMALGGFVEGNVLGVRLGATVSGAEDGGRAAVSAAYAFGATRLMLQVGEAWSDPAPPLSETLTGPGYQGGLDVSLTLRHAITSGLYVAGTAAVLSEARGGLDHSSMLFGASIGLRF